MNLGLGLQLNRAPNVARSTPLSNVIPSCVYDLAITIDGSYDGSSQNWNNLATPADGETQATYNFFLGSSGTPGTDDPTFVGTANDPAAYFLYDGNDRNRIQTIGNTDFINTWHRTDNTSGSFTFALTLFWPAAQTTGEFYMGGSSNANADHGLRFVYDRANEQFEITQTNGSSGVTTILGSSIVLTGDDWNLIVFTVTKTSGTGGTATVNLNGDARISTSLTTFGTTTTDATDDLQFSGVSGSAEFPNVSRATQHSVYNTALSEAQISTLASLYALRDQRNYLT